MNRRIAFPIMLAAFTLLFTACPDKASDPSPTPDSYSMKYLPDSYSDGAPASLYATTAKAVGDSDSTVWMMQSCNVMMDTLSFVLFLEAVVGDAAIAQNGIAVDSGLHAKQSIVLTKAMNNKILELCPANMRSSFSGAPRRRGRPARPDLQQRLRRSGLRIQSRPGARDGHARRILSIPIRDDLVERRPAKSPSATSAKAFPPLGAPVLR